MRQPRLRRSLLITPGHQLDRIRKAAVSSADAVVMDIEDGVSPEDKPAARRAIREALTSINFGRRERIVRVNAVGSAEHVADLAEFELSRIDALFVPKVESGDQLIELTRFLDNSPEPNARRIEIIATIETPRGLLRALEIADASLRTTAIFFGSGDYTAATGSEVTERSLATPRAIIVAAASAAHIEAIDAAFFAAVKESMPRARTPSSRVNSGAPVTRGSRGVWSSVPIRAAVRGRVMFADDITAR